MPIKSKNDSGLVLAPLVLRSMVEIIGPSGVVAMLEMVLLQIAKDRTAAGDGGPVADYLCYAAGLLHSDGDLMAAADMEARRRLDQIASMSATRGTA
jgi:hypothetical protein